MELLDVGELKIWYNIYMIRKIECKEALKPKGKFRFRTYDSLTGELKRTSGWIDNLIVSSNGHGLNLITRGLLGDNTYPLEITQAKIGTGTTAPVLANTDLETTVLDGIIKSNDTINNNEVILEFFISDLELTNGTYTEFGIFAGDQLFARALISPTYTKSSNEDTSVDYTLTFTSSSET